MPMKPAEPLKPGTPPSAMVGISGAVFARSVLVTPSAVSVPALMCGCAEVRSDDAIGICPPSTSVTAGALPR